MKSLNIWVCFKVQPDFSHVLESDWASFSLDSDISYAKNEINCFDESSLEIALRLKESLLHEGYEVHLGAVTLAPSLLPNIRKNLFAAGYDEILRLDARIEFSPVKTGKLLAARLAEKKPDIVFMGKQAGYADTGTVPYYAAEELRMPLLAEVENVTWEQGGLIVRQLHGGMRRELRISTPIAVVVGNSPVTVLRASTLRKRLEAAKHKETVIGIEEREVTQSSLLVYKQQERPIQMLAPESAADELVKIMKSAEISKKIAQDKSAAPSFNVPSNVSVFTASSADTAIRFAIRNNLDCINGVTGISEDGKSVITKVCGSNIEWLRPIGNEKQVWITSPTVIEEIIANSLPEYCNPSIKEILREEKIPSNPLPEARLLLVGGRGMGNAEGIAKLQELAVRLGGQTGITRGAAQNAWGGMHLVIGQSGVITQPDVCVAFGVSGAAAFMTGIEKAKTLIAVNTDPDAPIFKYADYGIIINAEELLNTLLEKGASRYV
ncbi:MAG: FAD-binding protein [Oscillospiraceae bacterium]|nr:FAD-binding protein [Oscillospiraceae bacterium]